MASSLTFQLRQQQKEELRNDMSSAESSSSLPSPPSSSCGDDSSSTSPDPSHGTSESLKHQPSRKSVLAQSIPAQSFLRRDSLGTQLSGLSLMEQKQPPASLPENYTIDHSAPIPIIHPGTPISSTCSSVANNSSLRRPSMSSPRDILATSPAGRPRRPSEANRKLRVASLSESAGRKTLHRCEECGKVYKHANCLYKHRWEHSEQWAMTSKLNITKHQQVQLLEAAAILVGMDQSRRDSQGSLPQISHIKLEHEDDEEELEIADGDSPSANTKESRESTVSLEPDTEEDEDEDATEDDEDIMMMEGL